MVPAWQKFLGIILYMIPLGDSLLFGTYIFRDLPVTEWIVVPALPVLLLEKSIPFGGFLLFFILFLGIVRNSNASYFLRFSTLQVLLVDIGIMVTSYGFKIIILPLGNSLIIQTLSSTIFLGIICLVSFCSFQCMLGKEADLPGVSEAVRIQL